MGRGIPYGSRYPRTHSRPSRRERECAQCLPSAGQGRKPRADCPGQRSAVQRRKPQTRSEGAEFPSETWTRMRPPLEEARTLRVRSKALLLYERIRAPGLPSVARTCCGQGHNIL